MNTLTQQQLTQLSTHFVLVRCTDGVHILERSMLEESSTLYTSMADMYGRVEELDCSTLFTVGQVIALFAYPECNEDDLFAHFATPAEVIAAYDFFQLGGPFCYDAMFDAIESHLVGLLVTDKKSRASILDGAVRDIIMRLITPDTVSYSQVLLDNFNLCGAHVVCLMKRQSISSVDAYMKYVLHLHEYVIKELASRS